MSRFSLFSYASYRRAHAIISEDKLIRVRCFLWVHKPGFNPSFFLFQEHPMILSNIDRKSTITLLSSTVLIAILLTGCAPEKADLTDTPELRIASSETSTQPPEPSPTLVPASPTSTAVPPTATPTLIPSDTLTPAPTFTPSLEPSPSPQDSHAAHS